MKKVAVTENRVINRRSRVAREAREAEHHDWVTVVNPTNHQMLLQACDHCGVVKSENSVMRRCRAPRKQSLLMGAGSNYQAVC